MKVWKNTSTLDGFDNGLIFTKSKNQANIALMGGKTIDLNEFPISAKLIGMSELKDLLMQDYKKKKEIKFKKSKKSGDVEYEEFYPRKSKLIIDEIDKILAEHYEFTQEELDFIINYDIKYRMGKELNN